MNKLAWAFICLICAALGAYGVRTFPSFFRVNPAGYGSHVDPDPNASEKPVGSRLEETAVPSRKEPYAASEVVCVDDPDAPALEAVDGDHDHKNNQTKKVVSGGTNGFRTTVIPVSTAQNNSGLTPSERSQVQTVAQKIVAEHKRVFKEVEEKIALGGYSSKDPSPENVQKDIDGLIPLFNRLVNDSIRQFQDLMDPFLEQKRVKAIQEASQEVDFILASYQKTLEALAEQLAGQLSEEIKTTGLDVDTFFYDRAVADFAYVANFRETLKKYKDAYWAEAAVPAISKDIPVLSFNSNISFVRDRLTDNADDKLLRSGPIPLGRNIREKIYLRAHGAFKYSSSERKNVSKFPPQDLWAKKELVWKVASSKANADGSHNNAIILVAVPVGEKILDRWREWAHASFNSATTDDDKRLHRVNLEGLYKSEAKDVEIQKIALVSPDLIGQAESVGVAEKLLDGTVLYKFEFKTRESLKGKPVTFKVEHLAFDNGIIGYVETIENVIVP